MKQYPKGITPKGGSIEIDFQYLGRRRERLPLDPHFEANIKTAVTTREIIIGQIRLGRFGLEEYAKYFPDSIWLKRQQTLGKSTTTETLSDFMRAWLASKKSELSFTVYNDYRIYIEDYEQRWPGIRPAEVTVSMVKQVITELKDKGLMLKTIRNRLAPLRGALDDAIDAEAIEINVAAHINWKKIKPSTVEKLKRKRKKIQPFGIQEIRDQIAAARNVFGEIIEIMYIVGFSIGPRISELLGMSWNHVNLEQGKLTFMYGRVKHRMTPLKTEGAERTIDLREFPYLFEALKRLEKLTGKLLPVDCGEEYGKLRFLFINPLTMRPFEDSDEFLDRIWNAVLKAAKVTYRSPKQIRHTFALLARINGQPDLWIAKQLGHTTTAMITKHYSKEWPDNAKELGFESGMSYKQVMDAIYGRADGKLACAEGK